MAAGTFTLFQRAKEFLGDGTMDLDTHTFKGMFVSLSYSPNMSHSVIAQISGNEISASGYTTGGHALTVDYTITGSTKTKCTIASLEVSGTGTKKVKYFVVYDDSVTGDPPLGYFDLETTSSTGVEATKIIITFPSNVAFKAS